MRDVARRTVLLTDRPTSGPASFRTHSLTHIAHSLTDLVVVLELLREAVLAQDVDEADEVDLPSRLLGAAWLGLRLGLGLGLGLGLEFAVSALPRPSPTNTEELTSL